MIIAGVAIGVLLVVVRRACRRPQGRRRQPNFLVAGRSLALPLSAAGLMGQAVDSNATLGNTDLSSRSGFWAGASLALGLGICLLLTGIFFAKPMNAMKLLHACRLLPDPVRARRGDRVVGADDLRFCILLAGNLVAGGFLFERFLGIELHRRRAASSSRSVLAYTIGRRDVQRRLHRVHPDRHHRGRDGCPADLGGACGSGLEVARGLGPVRLRTAHRPRAGRPINWATLIALGIGDIVAIDFMQRIFSARSRRRPRSRACFVGAAGTAIVGIPYALVALAAPPGAGLTSCPRRAVLFTLLEHYAPAGLTILVLSAIVAASFSTANGAILGTAAVAVRNIAGLQRGPQGRGARPAAASDPGRR